MGRKKKFIDKKKSATFQLMARDSSDPFFDGTPGSEQVFVRVDENQYSVDDEGGEQRDDVESDSIFADAPEDVDDFVEGTGDGVLGIPTRSVGEFHSGSSSLPDQVRREIIELGFPDDGYNYLLHMREIKNTGGGSRYYENPKALDQIPGDVKAYDASRVPVSEVRDDINKEDMSIYSIAAKTVGVRIQKVVDPEVTALLDDSDLSRFGSDVEDLEEDFVIRANLAEEGDDNDHLDDIIGGAVTLSHKSEEVIDELRDACFPSIHQDENVEQRGGGDLIVEARPRRLLDEQFDQLEMEEYATDEDEEEDGFCGYGENEDECIAEKLKAVLNTSTMDAMELEGKYRAPADIIHSNEGPESEELLNTATAVLRRTVEYAEKYANEDDGGEVVLVDESSDESEVWDCETIVTTYSNLDNHPSKIQAPGASQKKKIAETFSKALNTPGPVISLHGKEKIPVGVLAGSRKASAAETSKDEPSLRTEALKRKQHGQESKEEKKERKAAVKEERREARRLKKETKDVYRGEAQRAQRVAAVAGPSAISLR
ncbi:unnamed protein product [Linum tenue]|uniref:Low temperature viability protein n=1 Tax=Linum tenue TaxID=586396 RepID=A0AAV0LPM8_9ROSI|nr:unnamed protein product [Linum tenue]